MRAQRRVRLRLTKSGEPTLRTLRGVPSCSDGVEDQGADEALWGMPRESMTRGRTCITPGYDVSFGSRLPCERLSFQRDLEPWGATYTP